MLNLSFLRKDNLSSTYEQGEISEVIRQGYEWRVKAKGSYWTGMSETPISAKVGDRVQVVGTQGIRLLIALISVH
jgi:membrane protein implicated in regulation of membrane protease activity